MIGNLDWKFQKQVYRCFLMARMRRASQEETRQIATLAWRQERMRYEQEYAKAQRYHALLLEKGYGTGFDKFAIMSDRYLTLIRLYSNNLKVDTDDE